MRDIDIVLVSVNPHLLCGIYECDVLIESIKSDELLLDALPRIFERLLPTNAQDSIYKDTRIESICYANGPGSFSALKLTHIFLHTLRIVYDIKLFATSSFYFTKSPYIKAFGKSYFYRDENGHITLLQQSDMASHRAFIHEHSDKSAFSLPKILDKNAFNAPTQPFYVLPPV